jgi:tRNA U34 2-thiouridine synthase MnmA/TrmU
MMALNNNQQQFSPTAEQKRSAVVLFSGGLDSILAARLMLAQGIGVYALNFASPFYISSGKDEDSKFDAEAAAKMLGIPIKVVHKGVDFLEMVRSPRFGYGKGINPCIDCRIYLLKKAGEYMREVGADFIITGEVLGQRPMSQRRDAMNRIERESGLAGLILRPLSASFFAPTIPEQEGWVKRELLPSIKGRSRKIQMQLADELEVEQYPGAAGGCLLTEPMFAPKLQDYFDHNHKLDLFEVRLLKTGRHFRVSPLHRLILGRDEAENNRLADHMRPQDKLLEWQDGTGPSGLLIGTDDDNALQLAAKLLLKHTKAMADAKAVVRVVYEKGEQLLEVENNLDREMLKEMRI